MVVISFSFRKVRLLPCMVPVVRNGNVTIRGLNKIPNVVPPGTQMSVSCLSGYSFPTGYDPLQTRICTTDGEWITFDGEWSDEIFQCLL